MNIAQPATQAMTTAYRASSGAVLVCGRQSVCQQNGGQEMKITLELMCEAARRQANSRELLGDAGRQARHASAMDAPDTIEDGVYWYTDDALGIEMVAPREVNIRGNDHPYPLDRYANKMEIEK